MNLSPVDHPFSGLASKLAKTAPAFAAAGAVAASLVGVAAFALPSEVANTSSVTRADAFAVDNTHSSVLFSVDYFDVAKFWGRFNTVEGSYIIDMDAPSSSQLDISVKAESVDSNNADRDKHLRNPDFFDARNHPNIRFVAESFRAIDDDTVRATGTLTFRGKSVPLSVDLDYFGNGPDAWGNDRSGFQGAFTINRSEFGSTYGIDNNALADEVTLTVAITGTRK